MSGIDRQRLAWGAFGWRVRSWLRWTLVASTLFAFGLQGAESVHSARVAIIYIGASTSEGSKAPGRATGAFLDELRRLGYVQGRNLDVDILAVKASPTAPPDLAPDLNRIRPDVILTMGTMEATVAAMKATTTIPIVFVHAGDPVSTKLVASLGRPDGNVTGVTTLNADLNAKRFEMVTEIMPDVRRVAVLVSPTDPETPSMLAAVRSAAHARRVQLDLIEVRDPARLASAVGEAKKVGSSALLVLGSPPMYALSPSLAALTIKHRLPTVSAWREFAEAGGLASYGTSIPETFQRAARLVDRILRGSKPAELSVEQPTNFELVINLRAAKTLGVAIPESLRLQADKILR